MALFLRHKGQHKKYEKVLDVIISALTDKELAEICRRIVDNKGTGLDLVPDRAPKLILRSDPISLPVCMVKGVIPSWSKWHEPIWLPKPNK